ncbi:hypothetical protein MITS9504_02198 [Synechococcus sp. MIT S9504]|nr:hypothetical protein MITS9504_02198 [Synechococcus sp. MIT S9504]
MPAVSQLQPLAADETVRKFFVQRPLSGLMVDVNSRQAKAKRAGAESGSAKAQDNHCEGLWQDQKDHHLCQRQFIPCPGICISIGFAESQRFHHACLDWASTGKFDQLALADRDRRTASDHPSGPLDHGGML